MGIEYGVLWLCVLGALVLAILIAGWMIERGGWDDDAP